MRKSALTILFLAVFIGVMFSASLNAQPFFGRRMMGPGPGDGAQLLKDALQLTPEQEKKLEEFRKARLEEARAFREKLRQMREELRKAMADPKADEKKINSMIDEMAKFRADRVKAQFKNRKEWEKIFTPEQLKKLDEYRKDFQLRRELGPRIQGRPGWPGRMFLRHRGWCPGCWR